MIILCANHLFAQKAVIAMNEVQIYALPLEDSESVARLAKGHIVTIVGKRGDWVKVAFNDGQKGWMKLLAPQKLSKQNQKSTNDSHQNGVHKITAKNGQLREHGEINSKEFVDKLREQPQSPGDSDDHVYRRFGYAFGMGLIQSDYTYSWKFVFHSQPRLALEGSFKHVLGGAADSYFILANLSYLFRERKKFVPFATAGLGVINTAPVRSIDSQTVSNMAVNFGVGARKYMRKNLSLVLNTSLFTAFVGKGIRIYPEITVSLLIGKFWQ